VSSASVTVNASSTLTPNSSPSVYEVDPSEVVTTGAWLSCAVTATVLVAAFESTVPSFTVNSTVLNSADGLPVLKYPTERRAAW
jgi:hypothetical protein